LLIRNISSVYHIVAMRVIKHPGHTYGGFGSVLLELGYDRRPGLGEETEAMWLARSPFGEDAGAGCC
jgi:hypothetical protein